MASEHDTPKARGGFWPMVQAFCDAANRWGGKLRLATAEEFTETGALCMDDTPGGWKPPTDAEWLAQFEGLQADFYGHKRPAGLPDVGCREYPNPIVLQSGPPLTWPGILIADFTGERRAYVRQPPAGGPSAWGEQADAALRALGAERADSWRRSRPGSELWMAPVKALATALSQGDRVAAMLDKWAAEPPMSDEDAAMMDEVVESLRRPREPAPSVSPWRKPPAPDRAVVWVRTPMAKSQAGLEPQWEPWDEPVRTLARDAYDTGTPYLLFGDDVGGYLVEYEWAPCNPPEDA